MRFSPLSGSSKMWEVCLLTGKSMASCNTGTTKGRLKIRRALRQLRRQIKRAPELIYHRLWHRKSRQSRISAWWLAKAWQQNETLLTICWANSNWSQVCWHIRPSQHQWSQLASSHKSLSRPLLTVSIISRRKRRHCRSKTRICL